MSSIYVVYITIQSDPTLSAVPQWSQCLVAGCMPLALTLTVRIVWSPAGMAQKDAFGDLLGGYNVGSSSVPAEKEAPIPLEPQQPGKRSWHNDLPTILPLSSYTCIFIIWFPNFTRNNLWFSIIFFCKLYQFYCLAFDEFSSNIMTFFNDSRRICALFGIFLNHGNLPFCPVCEKYCKHNIFIVRGH